MQVPLHFQSDDREHIGDDKENEGSEREGQPAIETIGSMTEKNGVTPRAAGYTP